MLAEWDCTPCDHHICRLSLQSCRFRIVVPCLTAPFMQELMNKKDLVGDLFNQLRLRRQRCLVRQPEQFTKQDAELEDTLGQMLMVLDQLDGLIGTHQHDMFDMTASAMS